MTNSYPFVVSGDEFKGKRVLVTGGTKGRTILGHFSARMNPCPDTSSRQREFFRSL